MTWDSQRESDREPCPILGQHRCRKIGQCPIFGHPHTRRVSAPHTSKARQTSEVSALRIRCPIWCAACLRQECDAQLDVQIHCARNPPPLSVVPSVCTKNLAPNLMCRVSAPRHPHTHTTRRVSAPRIWHLQAKAKYPRQEPDASKQKRSVCAKNLAPPRKSEVSVAGIGEGRRRAVSQRRKGRKWRTGGTA